MRLVFFDADDTLWNISPYYHDAIRNFTTYITDKFGANRPYVADVFSTEEIAARKEMGFSRHTFPIAAVKTFVTIANECDGEITSDDILSIYMMAAEVFDFCPELKPGVESTITTLNRNGYSCKILTMGDQVVQSAKIYRSGISEYIKEAIIVPRKNVDMYRGIAQRFPDSGPFVMIGDSINNDINPALEAGWYAIHIPGERYEDSRGTVIEHEEGKFFTVDNIKGVVDVIGSIFEGSERV